MKLNPQRRSDPPNRLQLGLGLLLIISIGQGALRASPQADRSAWVLDEPSLARVEMPLLGKARSHDEQRLWVEIWTRSVTEGPLLAPALRDQLHQANRQELELCLISGLGLAGGPSARSELGRVLDREKASDRIIASFATIQDRVAAEKARFLRALSKGQKSQAFYLSSRLALLASPWKLAAKEYAGRARGPSIAKIRPLLNALFLARNPSVDPATLLLPSLGKAIPAAGSLVDHEERALLILACARPGILERAQLLAFLERKSGARYFDICSLALGRLDKAARAKPESGNLVTPSYLLGLESCSDDLRAELIRGPGPAHPLRWRQWHWCAAVQHLATKELTTLVPALLALETEDGTPAIQALCFRILMRGETLPSSESLVSLVENPVAPDSDPYRSVLAALSAPGRNLGSARRKVLGPLRSYALESWREGRIQGDLRVAGAQLWKLLTLGEWSRPKLGPGSWESALIMDLNDLVWNLLILGSAFVERTQPSLDRDRFLPDGVRRTDESYFRVLDAYLRLFPLFRSW